MTEELLAVCVLWWAVGVVAIMLVWVFLIHCGDLMKGAWQAMKGREWRWPEGPMPFTHRAMSPAQAQGEPE